MANVVNPVITTYKIDKSLFCIGDSFQMKIKTNDYKIGIIKFVSDDEIIFLTLNGDIIVNIHDVQVNKYELVKMEPDYTEGKYYNTHY